MKFTCNAGELLSSVSVSSRASAKKSVTSSLEGLLIKAKDNMLTIVGNNLELAIETTCEATVYEEGAVVVDGVRLGDILRRLPSGDAEFSLNSKLTLTIVSGNINYNIAGIDAAAYPEIPQVAAISSITLAAPDLKSIISKTLFAVSQRDVRPVLTGSLYEVENDYLNVVALDGNRLALKKTQIGQTNQFSKFIIPASAQSELLKILSDNEEESVNLTFDNKHSIIKGSGYTVVTRLIEGEFLAYRRSIPSDFKLEASFDTREFMRFIERAEPVIDDYAVNPIILSFTNGRVSIKCETRVGKVNDHIECDYAGEDLDVGFNYKYVHEAVSRCDTENIVIKGNSPTTPFIVTPKEDEDVLFLILPVRIAHRS